MIRLVVDKVPLKYSGQLAEQQKMLQSFKDYIDRYQTSRTKLDTVTELFSSGTIDLIQGDLEFESGNQSASIHFFNNAFNKFQEALKIGNTRSETEKLDKNYKLTPEIKYELERRTLYCQTRITHAEAITILKEAEKDERQSVLNLLQLSANSYQEELNFEQKNDDFHHSLLAFKNLFLVYTRISEIQSESVLTVEERRNQLYHVITHANKANFLGASIPDSFFERIRQKIKKLTIEKFQERADLYWGTGLVLSSEKNYSEASEVFLRGQQLYLELQRIEKNVEFEIQAKIMNITALEHLGRASIEIDKNEIAVKKFEEASILLRKLISTVREMGNTDLTRNFSIQQFYYDGMKLFGNGILSYDTENYEESARQLKGSKRILNQTLRSAEELENQALIESCREGINKCEALLETVNLMVQVNDEPVIDEPVVDEPVIDEPVVDEPVVDESVVDEPVVDESVVDESVVDEPVVDESVVDEPVVDEPVVDEPVVDELVVDEPVVDELVVDEPVVDEPVVDEPVVDEPVVDEPV
ncbi:MAG: hypothetical protein ACW981_08675, partial [Candidatus Hodarchaeales archaeon]